MGSPKLFLPVGCAILLCSVLLPAEMAASAKTSEAAGSWQVQWQPVRLVNGSPVVIRVTPPLRLEALSGKWLDHDLFFFFDAKSKTWFAVAGVNLDTKPGKYGLALNGKTATGKEVTLQKPIAVGKGKYRKISVTVPKQFTEPSAEQLTRIADDKTLKQQTFAKFDPQREWAGKFLPPVKAPISDVFGTARVFNGESQSVHQGLDFGVPEGTPVAALNRGTVLLARPLFFEGNCVMLDHGQGLLTIYMHLSKLEVKEGDQISRGQEIALSGGTGRASGPHLHVAVRWQGIYLDPAILLNLSLP